MSPTPPVQRLNAFLDRTFVFLMSIVPTLFLSWLMFHLARIEAKGFKNFFIGVFQKLYKVDLAEAEFEQIGSYDSFNHFFTRALKPGARKIDPTPNVLTSPVDGVISLTGPIQKHTLLQAKGLDYTLEQLVGNPDAAKLFENGSYCTIYLAPHNYHRIHMPATGRLRQWFYQPGRLLSVNSLSAAKIPKLFVRNERVGAVFDTDFGPIGIVMVGALFVGSIETVWSGRITPPHNQKAGIYSSMSPVVLLRGSELGRFNMGSTVILLAGPGMVAWRPYVKALTPLRVGLGLGVLSPVARK